VPDDVDGLGGTIVEALVEHRAGGGGVRAGRVEVSLEVTGQRRDEDERRGQGGDPGGEDGAAAAIAPGSEAGEA
jgi:hypothetical protein